MPGMQRCNERFRASSSSSPPALLGTGLAAAEPSAAFAELNWVSASHFAGSSAEVSVGSVGCSASPPMISIR